MLMIVEFVYWFGACWKFHDMEPYCYVGQARAKGNGTVGFRRKDQAVYEVSNEPKYLRRLR